MSKQNAFSGDILDQNHFEILEQKLAHKRYIQVTERLVKFPDGRIISWDVVGHKHLFVCIMAYNSKNKTVSLIKEYAQGPNREVFGFACGGYDPGKHKDLLSAAKAELSEEVGLKDGTWIELLKNSSGTKGISEVKWSTNVFLPYLVIDPVLDSSPGPKDPEEFITTFHNVTLEEVESLIMDGNLALPSVQTFFMALKYIKSEKV